MGGGQCRLSRAFWTVGNSWAFALNEVGATESLSRTGICPDSGAHRLPLAAVGGNRRWKGRAGARLLTSPGKQ